MTKDIRAVGVVGAWPNTVWGRTDVSADLRDFALRRLAVLRHAYDPTPLLLLTCAHPGFDAAFAAAAVDLHIPLVLVRYSRDVSYRWSVEAKSRHEWLCERAVATHNLFPDAEPTPDGRRLAALYVAQQTDHLIVLPRYYRRDTLPELREEGDEWEVAAAAVEAGRGPVELVTPRMVSPLSPDFTPQPDSQ